MPKKLEAIHPLAMAAALEEINAKCGVVIAAAHTAKDMANAEPPLTADQLRRLIERTAKAADDLRAALWGDET